MQKSHRFDHKSGIGALARAVNAGDPKQVSDVWQHGIGDIHQAVCQIASLGLINGDTDIVLPVIDDHGPDRTSLKVVFPMADGTLKKVLPSRLNDVETVYAMAVHKSQGSEFDHTAPAFPGTMSPVLTRELIYTAITRSRTRLTLLSSHANLLSEAVKRRVHRASGLGELFNAVQQ